MKNRDYSKLVRRARQLWRYGRDRHWYRSRNNRKIGTGRWGRLPGDPRTTINVSRDLGRRLRLTWTERANVMIRLIRKPETPEPFRSQAAVARYLAKRAASAPVTPEPGTAGTNGNRTTEDRGGGAGVVTKS